LVGRCRAASATCADLSARLEQAEEEIQRLKTLEADEE
jgi:ABC-type transporter Mla maintaining outer membrane lipid asymmetry permease subunit MlaE